VVEDASSVVEEAAAEAPPAPAVEVQAETVVHDAAAAPETPPTAEAINLAVPDDFTKIEGIGKYYNDALHKLGITTFADLAQQNAEGLVAQLKANGYRQHPAIPTWAEQAALAAAGDWDGLAALQKTLDGGRRTEG
jgi:predicted flap endonuclease-1-like 5' DNA nuclease